MDGRTAKAERTKHALLDAALTEFADRGFAGARVLAIAEAAGVNKQLISYHFGGKEGLYRALLETWSTRERELRELAPRLDDLAVTYLEATSADPRWTKLAVRMTLDGDHPVSGTSQNPPDGSQADLEDLRARHRHGELAPELDPESVLLAITGMVTAPILFGSRPADYATHLRSIVRRLTADDDQPGSTRQAT